MLAISWIEHTNNALVFDVFHSDEGITLETKPALYCSHDGYLTFNNFDIEPQLLW